MQHTFISGGKTNPFRDSVSLGALGESPLTTLRGPDGGRYISELAADMKGRELIPLSDEKGLGAPEALGLRKFSQLVCPYL